ncbi:hypothetical protein [Lutibacter oricola]|nr:hypothetical protein [Lutibacter oricola]
MASIKNLKKDINYVLGDIIQECLVWELLNPKGDVKGPQAIVDEAIVIFDDLIVRLNEKGVENKKSHFKAIGKDLETSANNLIEKINKL